MSLKIYISGPVCGIENDNYDAFYGAAVTLRGMDYKVLNPLELGSDLEKWSDYLSRDLIQMIEFEPTNIVTLPGWQASKGACLEIFVARMLFNSTVDTFEDFISRQGRR